MDKEFWEKIDRLEEAAKKATHGPWHSCYDPQENMIEGKYCEWVMGLDPEPCPFATVQGFSDQDRDCFLELIADICPRKVAISPDDLEFMAASNPAMILEIIRELRILQKKLNDFKN